MIQGLDRFRAAILEEATAQSKEAFKVLQNITQRTIAAERQSADF